jgi:hypothetical protein
MENNKPNKGRIRRNELLIRQLILEVLTTHEIRLVPKEAAVPIRQKRNPQAIVNSSILVRMRGYKLRTAQENLRIARVHHKLAPRTPVTVEQYAIFSSIDPHVIYKYL